MYKLQLEFPAVVRTYQEPVHKNSFLWTGSTYFEELSMYFSQQYSESAI